VFGKTSGNEHVQNLSILKYIDLKFCPLQKPYISKNGNGKGIPVTGRGDP
jgi:hypothetical protein